MNRIKSWIKEADYSYVIVALCFVMVFLSLGFCSGGRSLYLTAITDALDFSRGAFSLSLTFRFLTSTVVNLFFGKLLMRFGTKKLVFMGFLSLIAFALVNATATTLWGFYLGGIFLGMGISWTGTTMISTIINRWCKKNKATMTGAVLSANGLGSAFAIQVVSPIIFEEGNPFGYRNSYYLISVILVVIMVLFLILYRDPPLAEGETAPIYTKKKRKARGVGWVGMEYSETIRKPYFYLALLCMFLIGMVLQGLSGISVPHMYDIGLEVEYVALTSSFSGILLTVYKFFVGVLYDRNGIRLTTNAAILSSIVAMLLLIFMENNLLGQIFAFLRVIFSAFALPLETVMLPIFASEFFGNKSFDKIIGFFVAASSAGFAIGAPFGNLCYDIFGDYKLAFFVFFVLMVFVFIAMQFVLKAAKRDKERILAEIESANA